MWPLVIVMQHQIDRIHSRQQFLCAAYVRSLPLNTSKRFHNIIWLNSKLVYLVFIFIKTLFFLVFKNDKISKISFWTFRFVYQYPYKKKEKKKKKPHIYKTYQTLSCMHFYTISTLQHIPYLEKKKKKKKLQQIPKNNNKNMWN